MSHTGCPSRVPQRGVYARNEQVQCQGKTEITQIYLEKKSSVGGGCQDNVYVTTDDVKRKSKMSAMTMRAEKQAEWRTERISNRRGKTDRMSK